MATLWSRHPRPADRSWRLLRRPVQQPVRGRGGVKQPPSQYKHKNSTCRLPFRRQQVLFVYPLSHRYAMPTPPRGGAFQQLPISCNRALPSGELARIRLRGFSFFFIPPPVPASGRTAFPRGTAAAAAKRGHRPLPPGPRAFVPARCQTGVPCPSPVPAQS